MGKDYKNKTNIKMEVIWFMVYFVNFFSLFNLEHSEYC